MIQAVIPWVLGLLAGSFLLTAFRLFIGPTLPDRVAALDLMAVILMCLIGVFAIQRGEGWFLDGVLVLGLLGFLSTVAFARYMEKEKR